MTVLIEPQMLCISSGRFEQVGVLCLLVAGLMFLAWMAKGKP